MRVPQVRFKGFSGEWEERPMGECVLVQRGGSPRPIDRYLTDSNDGINWIKIGDVKPTSRYITTTKEKIIPAGEKKSRRVAKGDLILSNSMSFGRPYIVLIDGCIHDGWLLIHDEEKLFNAEYLLQLLSTPYMYAQYKSLASGGVVNNLNCELVKATTVIKTSKLEQTKIGNFFKDIDKAIALEEQKHIKLMQMKKALLEKMFPKENAQVPEIRFQGFCGYWEERFLASIYKKIRNAFVGTATPFYVERGHFYLESNNVKNGNINKKSQIGVPPVK